MKRNFLGDMLHTLTGVATDDQLQAQLRLDEEIREKVLSILTHQTQYEEEVAKIITGLSKEEEGLSAALSSLQAAHLRDFRRQTRLNAVVAVVDSDLQMLEDILDSIMHEVTPGRLSAYLSFKSGLPSAVPFTFVNATYTGKAVEVLFESYLYQEHQIVSSTSVYNESALLLRTRISQYLVHPHHPSLGELSVNEVGVSQMFYLLLVLLTCSTSPLLSFTFSLSPPLPSVVGGEGAACVAGVGGSGALLFLIVVFVCVLIVLLVAGADEDSGLWSMCCAGACQPEDLPCARVGEYCLFQGGRG